jgi:hypothetical protein
VQTLLWLPLWNWVTVVHLTTGSICDPHERMKLVVNMIMVCQLGVCLCVVM